LTLAMERKPTKKIRIVSLAPSATSILCAIGAKNLLVGVTKWCADVAPVEKLPKLGDCWHLESVEEIVKLRPALLIGGVPFKPETVAKLLGQPFAFLAMNPRTLGDIESDIRMLGRIAGRPTQAERVVRKMRETLRQLAKSSGARKKRVRVYCEAWHHPRISSPPWVGEIVRSCGGEMVVPGGQKVSDEQVAEAQPEVMVLAWAATGEKANVRKAYAVEAWKDVPAIRNKRVYVVRDEWLNTPGPPLLEGARELARILRSWAGGKG
jgi:ABC-type Fe3+-hydroxamate transport system substrate-binding protein